MTTFSESRRQTIHIAMVGFAFTLRWLSPWQAAALAAAALGFNAFVLPRAGGRSLYRPVDLARGASLGILFYPASVLLLIVALPDRLDLVAAAWAILGIGDGTATLVGRALNGRRLPWNIEKTWYGFAAFATAGGVAAVALACWTAPAITPRPTLAFLLVAPLVAALVAALVETAPVRLDDNLSVPFAAGVTLWTLTQASSDAWIANVPVLVERIGPALLVNGAMAAAAWATGGITVAGAVIGGVLGCTIYMGAGLTGWLMLLASFAAATVSSRLGWTRKALLGIQEEGGGRRGAGNAIANVLVAAGAAALATGMSDPALARLALVTALTAGASDTVASEIGKAWGRRTLLIVGLVPVKPGTPGAMSLEGTAAGLTAAFAMGALASALGLIPASAIIFVALASTAGALVESALGATFEAQGVLNNDWLNFINTATAAAVALLAWSLRA